MRRAFETTIHVSAPAEAVFARLDDHTRLAAHMERPSAMMGGGRMSYEFDEGRGQAVGSHIKMGGSAFGLSLDVDEIVTQRDPPRRKVWETVGQPRLVVIGAYEMGFEITPANLGSNLRVWIAYDLSPNLIGRWLGPFLAPLYAKWCVGGMVSDAAAYFRQPANTEPCPTVLHRGLSAPCHPDSEKVHSARTFYPGARALRSCASGLTRRAP